MIPLVVITVSVFWYHFAFCCFGQLTAIAYQQVNHAESIKESGGFSLGYWIKKNGWRVVLTACTMIAGVLFTERLTGFQLNEWTAFLSGMFTDKTIEVLIKLKQRLSKK